MVAETKVQFICEENLNAPTLPNTWNSLIAVLDAALVTGLNLPAINNVQIDGSVILINFSSAHQLKMFQIISLSGFSPVELNTKWRIIGVPTSQQIAIDRLDTITAITTVGMANLSPLGYEKTFSATGKGVYRNANTEAEHRPFLRVDATLPAGWTTTYAKFARVAVMTECAGIDDITSRYQMPFDVGNPNKNWNVTGSGTSASTCWAKWLWSRGEKHINSAAMNLSESGIDGNRKWMIIGDGAAFYIVVQDQYGRATAANQALYGFGVYEPKDNTLMYPYFLASLAGTPTAGENIDITRTQFCLPFCGTFDTSYSDGAYRAVSDIFVMSNTGGTTTANTYFGKHDTAHIAGDVTTPHYVQFSGALKGVFPHIYTPHSNFGTNYNNAKIIEGSMFITTPVYYRHDTVMPSLSWYGMTVGMPFYLGEI